LFNDVNIRVLYLHPAAELKRRERRVNLIFNKYRTDPGVLEEETARNQFDCAARCRSRIECQGANFRFPVDAATTGSAGTCRMFLATSDGNDLSDDPQWVYLAHD